MAEISGNMICQTSRSGVDSVAYILIQSIYEQVSFKCSFYALHKTMSVNSQISADGTVKM